LLITGERQEDAVANELIDDHLRSLLGNRLTDVGSSDQPSSRGLPAGRSFCLLAWTLRRRGFRSSADGST
jgi:hypothetical protein